MAAGLFWLLQWLAANFGRPWLWMRQMGYERVFWGVLFVKWALVGSTFLLASVCTWLNLRHAGRVIAGFGEDDATEEGRARLAEIPARARVWIGMLAAVAAGWYFAARIGPGWKTLLDFRWGGGFGRTEPIFGRDIGYYVFSLPFYRLIQGNLGRLLLVQVALVAFAYAYAGGIHLSWKRPWLWVRNPRISKHLALHLLVWFCLAGWGFYLRRYALLYEPDGVVYGVGYTADHVLSVTLVIMVVVSLLLAVVVAFGLLARRLGTIAATVPTWFALYLVCVVGIPALVRAYVVKPNELQLESPYLKNNIAFTRFAFGLENVEVRRYPVSKNLTAKDLADNGQLVENIPLWNPKPLLPSLRQTQEMRPYYQFYDADVDRYHLPDGYRQVLVSARQLAPALPARARTWVNSHLQFTHGYGLVMSLVSGKEPGGLPSYVIEDIPPRSAHGLRVERPAIYYGENMAGFSIVGTGVEEFDYPRGDRNVYTSYNGTGGVPLNSLAKRLLFALAQGDVNILISKYIGPESRIQLWRRVRQRVHQVVPFLALDRNPYPVLSDGKLYWIQDAYTVASHFPYTMPRASSVGVVSYIRDSVKAIVDAYNGTVELYAIDPNDPILAAYRRAFGKVFKPLSELPAGLRRHLRYPRDLFAVQSDVFRAYHMTDVRVFYNQEDIWSLALRKRSKAQKKKVRLRRRRAKRKPPDILKPYYLLTKLPGYRKLEFVLLALFTPQDRDNLIAWMVARCDFPDYGRLVVYELPKEHVSYGPAQVQAMINQDAYVSQRLSLWDQKGSHVITGDLVAVPVADSFLYVEPVYLTSEGLNLPQLKRVIAVQADRVAMGPTLQEAVARAIGLSQPRSPGATGGVEGREPEACPEKEQLMRAAFLRAERALRESDWGGFGRAMAELRDLLAPGAEGAK